MHVARETSSPCFSCAFFVKPKSRHVRHTIRLFTHHSRHYKHRTKVFSGHECGNDMETRTDVRDTTEKQNIEDGLLPGIRSRASLQASQLNLARRYFFLPLLSARSTLSVPCLTDAKVSAAKLARLTNLNVLLICQRMCAWCRAGD